MGHAGWSRQETDDDVRQRHVSLLGALSSSVNPDVVALAQSRRGENLAICSQLLAIAGMHASLRPDAERIKADRRRGRHDVSAESTHEGNVVDQTAATLDLTVGAAARRVDAAQALFVTRRLPRTAELAVLGRLDWRRIDALVVKTRDLTPEQTAAVEAEVLVPAVRTLTIGRFEDAVDRAVLAADPASAEERRTEVARTRRVCLWKNRNGADGIDGGATFRAEGPADALTAAMTALDAAARWWRDRGDPRTLDQLRHDLFVTGCTTGRLDVPQQVLGENHLTTGAPYGDGSDAGDPDGHTIDTPTTRCPDRGDPGSRIVDTPAPHGPDADNPPSPPTSSDHESTPAAHSLVVMGPRPQVPVHLNVTVSLQTLLGLNEEPGVLDGYGPLPAQMVRDLAADAIWRCVAVDDTHGTVLGVGRRTYTPGYVPGKNLRTFLAVASPTCEIPWCTTKAERCDADHRTPYASGGPTCVCNVGPTCRRHHRAKTAGVLTVEPSRDPTHPPGTMIWTTAGGERFVVRPYAPLPPQAYRTSPGADAAEDSRPVAEDSGPRPLVDDAPPF